MLTVRETAAVLTNVFAPNIAKGPAACPGRHLVLMLTSAFLSHLLDGSALKLESPGRLKVGGRLPGTLDNYSLRFGVEANAPQM